VDEKGTTAAAVTVIVAPASDMPPNEEPPPFEMTVDRPFVFLLTERVRGGEVILFVGAVNNIEN
jgi:serine protease inhibitor